MFKKLQKMKDVRPLELQPNSEQMPIVASPAQMPQNPLLAAVKISQMKISTKDLKNIEVELNPGGGFTVWVTEIKIIEGKKNKCRHWILDGSCIKKDGEIRIGNKLAGWKVEAKYDNISRSLKIVRG